MEENKEMLQKPTSVIPEGQHFEYIKKDNYEAPTIGLVIVLVCALLILKMLIYIKDEKRHGK